MAMNATEKPVKYAKWNSFDFSLEMCIKATDRHSFKDEIESAHDPNNHASFHIPHAWQYMWF